MTENLMVIGIVVTALGLDDVMERTAAHAIGRAIEATSRSMGGSGVEFLVFGLVGSGFGVFLVGRSLLGNPWP